VPEGVVLASDEWMRRRAVHAGRVDALLGPYLRARAAGRAHPVTDFLFTYYSLKPGELRRWHPGFGVVLAAPAPDYAKSSAYRTSELGVTVDPALITRRRQTIEFVHRLLSATAARAPLLACFGLHEWAMVYRAEELRHGAVPLRLGRSGTDAVVESLPLRCTHFDAYRFFTEPARPRNDVALTRETQVATEQPGCLHATMDLYKFTYKLLPLVDSELLVDALELAYAARELDMRASPYDLRDFGYEPVAIETAAGRAEYTRAQAELSARAVEVRAALLRRCRDLLEVGDEPTAEREAGDPELVPRIAGAAPAQM
jgi:hypothetical protein